MIFLCKLVDFWGKIWLLSKTTVDFSTITGLAYVNIKQIPNEKLVFLNDWKETRNEDAIIGKIDSKG